MTLFEFEPAVLMNKKKTKSHDLKHITALIEKKFLINILISWKRFGFFILSILDPRTLQ